MLHKDPSIIHPETLNLIRELQEIEGLENFHLVGGTSLALQLGHRNSVDIDLFSTENFDDYEIMELVKAQYSVKEVYRRKNTIIAFINNIKTDFITHNYPFILPPIIEDGIRFLSKEDISAMKIHAIIQSGKRLKDFIDIYFLLEHFCMEQMIDFFTQKYSYMSPMIALKAINYFDDIDENIDPPKMLKPISFSKIKKRIQEASLKRTKIFAS